MDTNQKSKCERDQIPFDLLNFMLFSEHQAKSVVEIIKELKWLHYLAQKAH